MNEKLKCPDCGATENKLGQPWTETGLRIHRIRIHNLRKQDNGTDPPPSKKQKRPAVVVSFCPCCGINLALVQAAINVAGRVK